MTKRLMSALLIIFTGCSTTSNITVNPLDGKLIPTKCEDAINMMYLELTPNERHAFQGNEESLLQILYFVAENDVNIRFLLQQEASPLKDSCADYFGNTELDKSNTARLIIFGVWKRINNNI